MAALSRTPGRRELWWRCLPSLAGLSALAVLVLLFRLDPPLYDLVLRVVGLEPQSAPFLDATYVLGSARCARDGVDVYLANPCDPLGRPYDYSPLLLDLLPPSVSVGWATAAGLTLAMAFPLSLAFLPFRAAAPDALVMTAAGLSTMVVYALERANIDAAILVAMIGAAALAGRTLPARLAGDGVILFAGLLKFYPCAALVAIGRERWRLALALGAAAALAIALFVLRYRADLFRAVGNRPAGFSFTDGFAAANLPEGLAYLLAPAAAGHPVLVAAVDWVPLAVSVVFAVRAIGQARRFAGRAELRAPEFWSSPAADFAVIGAALVAGCFLTGFSIYYRGVDFLLVLPGLLSLARSPLDEGGGRTARRVVQAILFLMWSECLRTAIVKDLPATGLSLVAVNNVNAVFWLIRELVWWRVIAVLLGILLAFAATTELGRWLRVPRLIGTMTLRNSVQEV